MAARPLGKNKKEKPLTEAPEPVRRSRARGALLGLSVGEALGAPCRGRSMRAPDFPELISEGPYGDMRGGGPYELARGQVSWGVQMAAVLATQLYNERHYDVEKVGRAYAQWLPYAVQVPEATRLALELITTDGRHPEFTGRRVFLENARRFVDNGALARVAPIACFYWQHRAERVAAALADSAITHFAPICQLANAIFAGVLATAIATPAEKLDAAALIKVLDIEIPFIASALAAKEPDWVLTIKDATDLLREDLRAAQQTDPMLYGPDLFLFQPADHVRIGFRLALWHFFHGTDLRAALTDTVHRGGDADTNAALVGALLGAVNGDKAVPAEWTEFVVEGPPGLSGPVATAYHPRNLLLLAGVEADPPRPPDPPTPYKKP